jgi:hypothetical protein
MELYIRMNWVQALKEWNTGKDKWCVPRKGTPEYDEVRELMSSGQKTESGREQFLRSERDKAAQLYYRYEDSKTATGKKIRDKAANLVERYDKELNSLVSTKPRLPERMTKKEKRASDKALKSFAESMRREREKDSRPNMKQPGVASAIPGLREIEKATKERNKMRKTEAEAKNPMLKVIRYLDEVIEETDKLTWEDIGNPDLFIAQLNQLKANLLNNDLHIRFSHKGRLLDDETVGDALKPERDYYYSDGDYGGTDYNTVSIKQLKFYLLFTILNDDNWEMERYIPLYVPDSFAYWTAENSESAYEKYTEDGRDYVYLYDKLKEMPDDVLKALKEATVVKLSYSGGIKEAERKIDQMYEDEEEWYGDDFFRTYDVKVTLEFMDKATAKELEEKEKTSKAASEVKTEKKKSAGIKVPGVKKNAIVIPDKDTLRKAYMAVKGDVKESSIDKIWDSKPADKKLKVYGKKVFHYMYVD